MIAVVQRVTSARVDVPETDHTACIHAGLVVLLAVEPQDTADTAAWMSHKLAHLRIIADDDGRMNRSILDTDGQVLLVSQFTLAGDCSKGHRPSFIGAANPDLGRHLYEAVAESLDQTHGVTTRTGVFGASMQVSLVNDGPVTLILQSP